VVKAHPPVGARLRFIQLDQPLRLCERQRSYKHTAYHSEDGGISANAYREGRYCGHRENWHLGPAAYRKPEILYCLLSPLHYLM